MPVDKGLAVCFSFIAHLSKRQTSTDLERDMRAIFAEDWRIQQFRTVALGALVTLKAPFAALRASTIFRMHTWPEKSRLSPAGTISLRKAKRYFVVDVVSDPKQDEYRMKLSLLEVRDGQFAKPAECPLDTDASVTISYDTAKATRKASEKVTALWVEEWPGMTFDVAITAIFMAVIRIVAAMHDLHYDVYLHNTSYTCFYGQIPFMWIHDDENKRRLDGHGGVWRGCRIQWTNSKTRKEITKEELSLKVPLVQSLGEETLIFHGPAQNLFLRIKDEMAKAKSAERAKATVAQGTNTASKAGRGAVPAEVAAGVAAHAATVVEEAPAMAGAGAGRIVSGPEGDAMGCPSVE